MIMGLSDMTVITMQTHGTIDTTVTYFKLTSLSFQVIHVTVTGLCLPGPHAAPLEMICQMQSFRRMMTEIRQLMKAWLGCAYWQIGKASACDRIAGCVCVTASVSLHLA